MNMKELWVNSHMSVSVLSPDKWIPDSSNPNLIRLEDVKSFLHPGPESLRNCVKKGVGGQKTLNYTVKHSDWNNTLASRL